MSSRIFGSGKKIFATGKILFSMGILALTVSLFTGCNQDMASGPSQQDKNGNGMAINATSAATTYVTPDHGWVAYRSEARQSSTVLGRLEMGQKAHLPRTAPTKAKRL